MNRKLPLVSIICTNYNKGEWIRQAIESFLIQETDFEFEIILIDDKSTDGSDEYIREYTKKYPEKIRAFFNEQNLGITKTWIKICKEAKGKYIARCDGDDYWIDKNKLQKQVDLLESNKELKWCSTDYNLANEDGKIIETGVFDKNIVKRAKSYEEILVTSGFTNPSTWLVETKLMQKINRMISEDAVDDTFNIQLELFKQTDLNYINEPMAVYRMNQGSDSKPQGQQKMNERLNRLLETQIEYLNKYKLDKEQAIIFSLKYSNELNKIIVANNLKIAALKSEILKKENVISRQEKEIEKRGKIIEEITNSRPYKMTKKIRSLKDSLSGE